MAEREADRALDPEAVPEIDMGSGGANYVLVPPPRLDFLYATREETSAQIVFLVGRPEHRRR